MPKSPTSTDIFRKAALPTMRPRPLSMQGNEYNYILSLRHRELPGKLMNCATMDSRGWDAVPQFEDICM